MTLPFFEEPHMSDDTYQHFMSWTGETAFDTCSCCNIKQHKRGPMHVYPRRRALRIRERKAIEHRHDHFGWHPMKRQHRLKPIVQAPFHNEISADGADPLKTAYVISYLRPEEKSNKSITFAAFFSAWDDYLADQTNGINVPVENYFQRIPFPSHQQKEKTIVGSSIPENCKVCGKRPCNRGDFKELCKTPQPAPRGAIVLNGIVVVPRAAQTKPEKIVKPKTQFIKSTALSMLRDDVYIPEIALKVPGIDEPPAKLEDYSATSFLDSTWEDPVAIQDRMALIDPDPDMMGLELKKLLKAIAERAPARARKVAAKLTFRQWQSLDKLGGLAQYGIHPIWDEPEPEGKLRATEHGFEVVTRKQKNDMRFRAEEKRQDRFLIHHGFRIKDKLEKLLAVDPVKAKALAAKLTFQDWQALNHIGGLSPNPGMGASEFK